MVGDRAKGLIRALALNRAPIYNVLVKTQP
jgi:hypothetical protein